MFGLTLRCVPGGPLLRTAAGVRLVRAASCRPSMAAATAATAAAGAGIRAGSTRIACRRGYAADAGSEDDAADPEDDAQGLKTLSEEEQQLLGQLIHGAEAEGGASDKLAGSGPPEDADDSDNVYVDSFDDEVDPEVDLFEELDEEAAAALASEIAGMAEPPLSSELGSKQFPFRHNKKFEAPLRVSRESKLLIWQLWTKDPEAWNPKALSRAFGFRIERIRAILRHQQIELERMLKVRRRRRRVLCSCVGGGRCVHVSGGRCVHAALCWISGRALAVAHFQRLLWQTCLFALADSIK